MSIRRTLAVSAAALLLTAGCATSAAPPALPSAIDAAVTSAMASADVPGALVAVWSPQLDYVKAFGVADTATGRPMHADFYSRIGSVTKTFTATAVLQLVVAGKVRLDDPIGAYLDGVPDGQTITVRQLAAMRSGLADYTNAEGFKAAVEADPRREFTPQELLGWAYGQPVNFPPGQKFEYSNTNYILLGLLVENVSAKPLGIFLQENVFGPLGMAHTSFPTGTQFPDPHPRGYTEPLDGPGAPVDASGWTASFTWAAGAAISTLEDLRLWLPALADGTLLTRDLQEQRLRSEPEPRGPAGFGYGMGVFTVAGWIGHNGSVPGYQTVAVYLPAREMTLVVMINTDVAAPAGGDPSEVLAKAVTAVVSPDHVYAL